MITDIADIISCFYVSVTIIGRFIATNCDLTQSVRDSNLANDIDL